MNYANLLKRLVAYQCAILLFIVSMVFFYQMYKTRADMTFFKVLITLFFSVDMLIAGFIAIIWTKNVPLQDEPEQVQQQEPIQQ